jgi:hypothetical protein
MQEFEPNLWHQKKMDETLSVMVDVNFYLNWVPDYPTISKCRGTRSNPTVD